MKTREEQLAINVAWVKEYISAAASIIKVSSTSYADIIEVAKMLQAERHNAVVRAAVSERTYGRGGAR